MTITNIKINKTQESGRMKAVVSITFDHQIAVHDIKVIDGPERLFLAMPSRKAADGTFRDIIHPISAEARAMLEDAILGKYHEMESAPAADTAEAPAEDSEDEE
jgi:stage V sporulation protein G